MSCRGPCLWLGCSLCPRFLVLHFYGSGKAKGVASEAGLGMSALGKDPLLLGVCGGPFLPLWGEALPRHLACGWWRLCDGDPE